MEETLKLTNYTLKYSREKTVVFNFDLKKIKSKVSIFREKFKLSLVQKKVYKEVRV